MSGPRGSGDDPARSDEPAPVCGAGCGCAVGNEFGERSARKDLKSYRKNGPPKTTSWLIDGLADGGVTGWTVLDIGAGVGAVHIGLMAAGAASALDVDGSPAYIAVARSEAQRVGRGADVRHETGDFVELASQLEPADLVALDRVVCCYPDMDALVRRSVALARRRYGLVYPRNAWWIRAAAGSLNAVSRLFRQRFRIWIHRTADVEAIVRAAGFVPRLDRATIFWQVVVYERT
ncbi:MAG: methyltransferase domain-containing protein [Chloroflexi bacterium]|nr:methyltransferase domain-containing protein [Chloroflexota bacterium]